MQYSPAHQCQTRNSHNAYDGACPQDCHTFMLLNCKALHSKWCLEGNRDLCAERQFEHNQ